MFLKVSSSKVMIHGFMGDSYWPYTIHKEHLPQSTLRYNQNIIQLSPMGFGYICVHPHFTITALVPIQLI